MFIDFEYQMVLRNASHSSWKMFCEQLENVNDNLRIKKFPSKIPIHAENVLYDEGIRMEAIEQVFKMLMETQYLLLQKTPRENNDNIGAP